MSSITNVNNESTVVNVGRTTPVQPGVQPASASIPVVVASDQTPVPVEEQNKIQSEVALSLLGIPRAEVALGIFADVNTYDVNPSEWSTSPQYHITGYGVKHLPEEAGALVEAPVNKTAVLTSKRFFRYQPGRVSAATFGVKSSVSTESFVENPAIRKFGIYDNYDGYFWETRNNANGDNFSVVRRSQSLLKCPTSPTGVSGQLLKGSVPSGQIGATQVDDYRIIGQGTKETVSEPIVLFPKDRALITKNRFKLVDAALTAAVEDHLQSGNVSLTLANGGTTVNGYVVESSAQYATIVGGTDAEKFYGDLARAINVSIPDAPSTDAEKVEAKCRRDLDYWIDMYLLDMEYGGTNHTRLNTSNYASGIFPQISTFEKAIHAKLKLELEDQTADGHIATISATGAAKLLTLTEITETAFNRNNGSPIAVQELLADGYGNRSVIDTIFAAKMHYWAYVVASVTQNKTLGTVVMNNTAAVFTTSDIDIDPGDYITVSGTPGTGEASITGYTNPTTYKVSLTPGTVNLRDGFKLTTVGGDAVATVLGDTSTDGLTFTALGNGVAIPLGDYAIDVAIGAGLSSNLDPADIKYKCQRDLGYIIDGYRNDIAGGGEAETKYNMSMYFKNGREIGAATPGAGMSIYSQTAADGTLEEIERHTHLAAYIKTDLLRYGILPTSAEYLKLTALSSRVIANFLQEDTQSMVLGNRGFAGNLVAMRDGLIVTHAAVYDPTLLKPIESIDAVADAASNTFRLSKGHVTFGQHVKLKYTGIAVTVGLMRKDAICKVVKVFGPKGNEFSLETTEITIGATVVAKANITMTAQNITDAGDISFELVVPFIFPKDQYKPATYRTEAGGQTTSRALNSDDDKFPEGMVFPYMYSNKDKLVEVYLNSEDYSTGYINTAMDIGVADNLNRMCE